MARGVRPHLWNRAAPSSGPSSPAPSTRRGRRWSDGEPPAGQVDRAFAALGPLAGAGLAVDPAADGDLAPLWGDPRWAPLLARFAASRGSVSPKGSTLDVPPALGLEENPCRVSGAGRSGHRRDRWSPRCSGRSSGGAERDRRPTTGTAVARYGGAAGHTLGSDRPGSGPVRSEGRGRPARWSPGHRRQRVGSLHGRGSSQARRRGPLDLY